MFDFYDQNKMFNCLPKLPHMLLSLYLLLVQMMTLSLATYSILQSCFQKKVEILFNK